VNQPSNRCPVEWAKYNEHESKRQLADCLPLLPDVELDDLLLTVRRACNELQDMGPKSERIALQLLTAMGRFEAQR
jgi:hypothetical protein